MRLNRFVVVSLFSLLAVLSPIAGHAQVPDAPAPPPEANVPATDPAPAAPATAAPAPDAPAAPAPPPGTATEAPPASAGGRQLLLPDISVIGNLQAHTSSDRRDEGRDRLELESVELALQSDIYPGIRAQVYIVLGEEETEVEEAYLTVQNLGIRGVPLSAQLGKRKVPFGRVNQLHPHSWLYIVPPYALANLVAEESLNGQGAYVSYLLPTGKLFAQLDAGFWSGAETDDIEAADPSASIVGSPGAGFADRFTTLRLLAAADVAGGSLEVGGSLAHGRGVEYSLDGDAGAVRPTIDLSGLDLTYRRAGKGASRLLLRGEYLRHAQKDGGFRRTADGWYLLADQRIDPLLSVGIRYDSSEFPYAPGLRESAVSLIGTRRLTEQTYLRAQLIQGDRPGKSSFTEAHVQWIWGFGPHTHGLE